MAFILMYLLIYGGMHAYVVWRIKRALPAARRFIIAVECLAAVMIILPIFARRFEEQLGQRLGSILLLIGFTWFFWIFWFFMMGLAIEVWNGLIKILSRRRSGASRLSVPPGKAVITFCVVILLASGWGLVEASRINVKEYTIATPRLKPGTEPIRIVQLSDVHLGVTMPLGRFRKVIQKVRAIEPDLIVDTGDLIDVMPFGLDEHLALLAQLNPPLGKFAVTGNHEHYVGMEHVEALHEKTGFTLLRGRHVSLADGRIVLAGVDDPAVYGHGSKKTPPDLEALPPDDANRPFVILLKHQPRLDEQAAGYFDLQLSGHIHNGQIWPFRWFIPIMYDFEVGLHKLPGGGTLIISPGVGSWGTPMRLAAPPQILLIRLVPEGHPQ